MKKTSRIGLSLFALALLLALVVGGRVLRRHIEKTLVSEWIPELEQEWERRISVADTDVALLFRTVRLSDVRVSNSPGFGDLDLARIQKIQARVGLFALLRGAVALDRGRAEGVRVVLVRNTAGDFSLDAPRLPQSPTTPAAAMPLPPAATPSDPAREPVSPTPAAATHVPPAAAAPAAAARPRREVVIRNFTMNGRVEYVDLKQSPPFRLALETGARVHGVSNAGAEDSPWGAVTLTGHLEGNTNAFLVSLSGRVAPLTDALKPSFDAEGEVARVDPAVLRPLFRDVGVDGDDLTLKVGVKCRQGAFDPSSRVTAVIRNPRLTGRLAEKARHVRLPAEVSLVAPLGGTFENPRLYVETALLGLILQASAVR